MSTEASRQAVFVLGAARSGTTLVQRLLNSYDDVLVWGEHAGVLRGIADAFYRGRESPDLLATAPPPLAELLRNSDPEGRWQAWMGWVGRDEWPRLFRRMLELLLLPEGLPGKRVFGFKEIRYAADPGDRTIEFLRELYPGAIWAFVVRDPRNMVASRRRMAGGPRSLATLVDYLERWRQRYAAYWRLHGEPSVRSQWIVYEDLVARRGAVIDLLAELGRTFGPRQAAVFDAETGRRSSFGDAEYHARWRTLPWTWRALVDAMVGADARRYGIAAWPVRPGARAAGRLLRVLVGPGRAGSADVEPGAWGRP